MADKTEDTKEIKINLDEETVEQLVEDRFVSKKPRPAGTPHKKKSKKKKQNFALTGLITILGFVLVFVIFFIGSYIIFSSSSAPSEENLSQAESSQDKADTAISDEKDFSDADKSFDTEVQELPEIYRPVDSAAVQNSGNSKPNQKPAEKPAVTTDKESVDKNDKDDKNSESDSTSEDKKDKNSNKYDAKNTEKVTEKKPATDTSDKQDTSDKKNTTDKKSDSSSDKAVDVVEKNEDSEAISIE